MKIESEFIKSLIKTDEGLKIQLNRILVDYDSNGRGGEDIVATSMSETFLNSFVTKGLIYPLKVFRTGKTDEKGNELVQLKDGHRRFYAINLNIKNHVEMPLLGNGGTDYWIRIDLVENYSTEAENLLDQLDMNSGIQWTEAALAATYAKMVYMGVSVLEIAKKRGTKPANIQYYLQVGKHSELIDAVNKDTISISSANSIAKALNRDEDLDISLIINDIEILKTVQAKKITQAQVKKIIEKHSQIKAKPSTRKLPEKAPEYFFNKELETINMKIQTKELEFNNPVIINLIQTILDSFTLKEDATTIISKLKRIDK